MNTTKNFKVQILSNIDGSVLSTEFVTTTTDNQAATLDAVQARLEWFDHPWQILAA